MFDETHLISYTVGSGNYTTLPYSLRYSVGSGTTVTGTSFVNIALLFTQHLVTRAFSWNSTGKLKNQRPMLYLFDSEIRETIVKMMVAKARPRESQSRPCDRHHRGHDPATKGEALVECDNRIMRPSLCIFWCAVALGALSKGWPIKLVSEVECHN